MVYLIPLFFPCVNIFLSNLGNLAKTVAFFQKVPDLPIKGLFPVLLPQISYVSLDKVSNWEMKIMGRIVLSGSSQRLEGLSWESDSLLRIGSQESMDIVLYDPTISRRQAEVQFAGKNWVIRDLAQNSRYPTFLNGTALGRGDYQLKPQDLVQFGNMALRVTTLEENLLEPPPGPKPVNGQTALAGNGKAEHINASGTFVRVQARAHHSWDQALQRVTHGSTPLPQKGEGLLTLLRTGHHLCHIASLDELLQSVLADAVSALGAQRGSIVLANPVTGELNLRAAMGVAGPRCYSKTLAERVFVQGESLLCRDVRADAELDTARSVKVGTMASIICALLRSPRQRLGVLQLDRGIFQDAFEESDLYLADAVAASVAVGIESAQLVEQQREQFIQTVTSLARAVEVRDQYTGDHTRRVTDYALLLAEELKLPAMEKYRIQIGTPLHDIGKIGIDDAILRKPGKLTAGEFEMMKTHTVKGAAIVESIYNLSPMIPIVRHHHERWDGTGYPDRIAGDRIAMTARIVAVADAFDAMTSVRPYRPALSSEHAFMELVRKAGSHFDPACIDAFMRLRQRVEARLRQK
jgi:pSer/pThr/pTyr-binding forkhead associated (FHA) protein